jgi:fatty acid desaturase
MTLIAPVAPHRRVAVTEWKTLGLIAGCYAGWAFGIVLIAPFSLLVAVLVTGFLIALHSSLTHEVLHGHPFRSRRLNEALMVLPLNLVIPYNRFRDLHLAHHRDTHLTDPYDDPESNYLDPAVWARLPRWKQLLFAANNTLLGRITIGPALGTAVFLKGEAGLIRRGDPSVIWAWVLHGLGALAVLAFVVAAPMPLWAYLVAVYLAIGLLRIRTFLEHQAHEKVRGRTVIIEDRGILAFLFLNNNLHVVHHMHPQIPWYDLPQTYAAGKERFLACNEGYRYRSYGEVLSRYLLKAKDPVPHPLWRRD